jgi:8-oxo-dGTP diphosphatase
MKYNNPKVTVDGILIENNDILLIKRGKNPFKGKWALPGGFVEYGETTQEAIKREFNEETGLICDIIGLFGVYSQPDRDPRGHIVSIIYDLKRKHGQLQSGDDATNAKFFSLIDLPLLAFDHGIIIQDKLESMQL